MYNERSSIELDGAVRQMLAVVTATVRPQPLCLYYKLCCLPSQVQFVVTLSTQRTVVLPTGVPHVNIDSEAVRQQ
jgi:hypothetical protein